MAELKLIEYFQSRVSPACRTASDDMDRIRNSIPDKSGSEKRHKIFKSFVRETVQSSSQSMQSKIRSNQLNLQQKRFGFHIRKHLLTVNTVQHRR